MLCNMFTLLIQDVPPSTCPGQEIGSEPEVWGLELVVGRL